VNFYWGTATAAYQIEGGASEDGRGRSIWDTFSHTPGRTLGGDNGDVACDHYHRSTEDVAMMAKLGVNAYRFSISWPRVQPGGSGQANAKGLAFYDKLVDDLLGHGIEPFVTLYHWDLPQELEDAGGWPVRDTAYRFAEYAAIVRRALADRVQRFITLNEPWCSAFLGYSDGHHAPGRTNGADALAAAHHLNLAHALGAQALAGKQIGISLNLHVNEGDPEAVRRLDAVGNRIWLDPLFKGEYPSDLLDDTKGVTDWSFVRDGDLAAGTLSYLGVNYYTSNVLTFGEPKFPSVWPGSEHVHMVSRGLPTTEMGWEIDPPALTRLLVRVHEGYGPLPIFITENGMAAPDLTLDDTDRIEYLEAHFRAFGAAQAQGVPVNGYFLWSLMDNFEWSWGYSKRFGIIHVDYESQARRPKASAHWYSEFIRRGGLVGGTDDDPAHKVGGQADA